MIDKGDVCVDAPEGKVCLDPKSQHMSHTIYLARVGEDHSITFPMVWHGIKPYWLGDVGCDLTKHNPNAQYTPSNLPPKYLNDPSPNERFPRGCDSLRFCLSDW